MKTLFFTRTLSLLSLFLLLFAAGCSSNPVDGDDHDHAEVEGMVLLMNGEELFRATDAPSLGTLTVGAGEETGEIQIVFLDHDGEEIHFHDLEEEFTFGWKGLDASVASITQLEREEVTLVVGGLEAGTTTVELGLLHGEHFDFERDLTITVQ